MRRRLLACLFSLVVASSIHAVPARAADPGIAGDGPRIAGEDLWVAPVLDPTGVDTRIAVGADGVNHVVTGSEFHNGGWYAVDRGNHWSTQSVIGNPTGVGVGSENEVFFLTDDAQGGNPPAIRLRLYTDETGSLLPEDVPGSLYSVASAMTVGPDGVVHVAWSEGDWNLKYATRTDGVWGDITTIASGLPMPGESGIAMALDGNGTPHVLMSGSLQYAEPKPTGCSASVCTVDVTLSDTPTVTGIEDSERFGLDATTGPTGTIEAVYGTNDSLVHLSNDGGTWSSETIATGNILGGSIRTGPNGLVAFFATGDNTGVRQADLVGSEWQVTHLLDAGGPLAYGVLDADGRPRISFTYSWNHPDDGGYLPTTFVIAPDDVAPVGTEPLGRPTTGKVVGSTIPVSIGWSVEDSLSGIARCQLQQSVSGGAWSWVNNNMSAPSAARSLVPGRAYAYRSRCIDGEGNIGTFVTGPTIKATTAQQTNSLIKYGGTWYSASNSSYFGGTLKYATSSSSYAKVTASVRGFGWISTYSSTRGSVKIYVDGVWVTTVNLRKATKVNRVIAWSIKWPTAGTHTLMIKPVGTGTYRRVDLDGIVLVK